jgi:hypothetical protein
MEKDLFFSIEKEILDVLKKKDKDYLTVRQIVDGISATSRRQLVLSKKATTTEILNKLTPHLGEALQIYKVAKSSYIGYKRPLGEILLSKIKQKPGISSKQLGRNLPVLKKVYIETLNVLLEKGSVICTFKENYADSLRTSDKVQVFVERKGIPINARAAFKGAYNEVGKGRNFVPIHRIREQLNWTREQFDQVLMELMADYVVEPHGGDPSTMTEIEIRNSFMDENGMLYIAVSWRGETS